jgi:hypothetical protein
MSDVNLPYPPTGTPPQYGRLPTGWSIAKTEQGMGGGSNPAKPTAFRTTYICRNDKGYYVCSDGFYNACFSQALSIANARPL